MGTTIPCVLSITSCYAKDLDFEMKNMIKNLRCVLERLRKRHKRGKGPEVKEIEFGILVAQKLSKLLFNKECFC